MTSTAITILLCPLEDIDTMRRNVRDVLEGLIKSYAKADGLDGISG